ncbi:hypothetical protein MKW92_051562 [Papaver armeniacum]|nr:hypothetical protein MKW92_051562 [Papaver armeniacum]
MSLAVESKIDGDYDCDKQMKKKQMKEGGFMQIDGGGGDFQISLPIELILEFLSRLPIKSLMRLSCTSKYLYNTVTQNPNFARSHFINYSQKYPFLVLYVNCLTAENPPKLYKNLFHPWDVHSDRNDNHDVNVSSTISYRNKGNFLGYCNGLICFAKLFRKTAVVDVWNFTTNELLRIIPPVIFDKDDTSPIRGFEYPFLSRGFGFDSLNNEYKLVFMLNTGSCRCLVYTFGSKSCWKDFDVPEKKATSVQGTFIPYGGGGGALFWKTSDPGMILMFDLHQDKFQYIRIPLERNEYRTRRELFECKGFLGVAILIRSSSSGYRTLEKVHLKIYKDNQVWVKETFDISPYSIPFSDNFRCISFSDQVLLYWMDPNCFQFFNLHSKCLKVVRKLTSCIWEKRLPQCARAEDYWLDCEVQNISSLTTLLPERAQKSDQASVNSMMMKGIEDMLLLQEPKTCGGFFTLDELQYFSLQYVISVLLVYDTLYRNHFVLICSVLDPNCYAFLYFLCSLCHCIMGFDLRLSVSTPNDSISLLETRESCPPFKSCSESSYHVTTMGKTTKELELFHDFFSLTVTSCCQVIG